MAGVLRQFLPMGEWGLLLDEGGPAETLGRVRPDVERKRIFVDTCGRDTPAFLLHGCTDDKDEFFPGFGFAWIRSSDVMFCAGGTHALPGTRRVDRNLLAGDLVGGVR